MAYEIRPIEDLEIIARDLEEVAARLRNVIADVRQAGLTDVSVQLGTVGTYFMPRLNDWSFSAQSAAHKYIRNKRQEAAGAALAQRRLAELSEKSTKTTKPRTKKTGD